MNLISITIDGNTIRVTKFEYDDMMTGQKRFMTRSAALHHINDLVSQGFVINPASVPNYHTLAAWVTETCCDYRKETPWGTHEVTKGMGRMAGKFIVVSTSGTGVRQFHPYNTFEEAKAFIDARTAPLPDEPEWF